MTETLRGESAVADRLGTPVLDVVIPVYNEEADLGDCVRRLDRYLATSFPYPYRITIADNASVDATPAVAGELAAHMPRVRVVTLGMKGRGHALHFAWSTSDAHILAYMDVDLSTDLAALLPLVAPLISGHSDVAIGTRLSRSARVVRGLKREVISRCYNAVLRTALQVRFSDAQCGFKAIRRDVAAQLLPHIEDRAWFFDTELLVLAQRAGLRIHEVPVDWVDDPDTRVDLVPTAIADLKGVWRMSGLSRTKSDAVHGVPIARVRELLKRGPGSNLGPGPAEPTRLGSMPSGSGPLSSEPLSSGPLRSGPLSLEPFGSKPFGSKPFASKPLGPQLVRFVVIGLASTIAYLVLYALLRGAVPSQAANMLSLLATAIANTAMNRRWTFGVQGPDAVVRHHLQGLLVFVVCLALTSSALALLSAFDPGAGRLTEIGVLVGANLLATLVRFVALRTWVFAR